MKKIILLLLIIIITGAAKQSHAQNKKMDSLNVALKNATQDTTRLRIYLALCDACDVKDNLKYGEPALRILDKLISEAKTDKERKKRLEQKADVYAVFRVYYDDKKDTAKFLEVQQKRVSIYQEAKDTEAIIGQIRVFSNFYLSIGNFHKAIEYGQKALTVSKQMNYKKGIAGCLMQIGKMYSNQGETTQALENYKNALSIIYEIKDTNLFVTCNESIGILYGKLHIIDKSLDYFHKAISLSEVKLKSVSLNESKIWEERILKEQTIIGEMYKDNNETKNALIIYEKGLSMSEKMNDKDYIKEFLDDIGMVYKSQGDISKAIEFHLKALKIAEESKSEFGIAWSYFRLARAYNKQKNYKMAKDYIEHFLKLKKKILYFDKTSMPEIELTASEIDSAIGNYNGAYEHYKQYVILNDKSKSEEIHKLATQEKYQKELDKQQAEHDKKDVLAKAESKKQKLIIVFVGLGLLLVLVFAGFIFRSLRIRNKQNKIIVEQKNVVEKQKEIVEQQKHIVEEKQREILDSIEYALRIQTAILPPARIVKQYLENSFILYKPKDIVAGDFYWMETVGIADSKFQILNSTQQSEITNPKSEIILFAACDCTGHGVPGAMVSVVCHNALNRAVREFGLTQPAAILDKTAEIVIENFSESEEDIKDGMDISLVSLKFESPKSKVVQIEWAGANNPLWIVRKVDTPNNLELGTLNFELIETKADKQPIGMNEDSKPFTNHSFTLNTGDTIYLFTDGFADQFGGDSGEKKLTRKRFKELLLSIQHKSMPEQCIALDNFIVDYRKQVEQIDDILVMGVRV